MWLVPSWFRVDVFSAMRIRNSTQGSGTNKERKHIECKNEMKLSNVTLSIALDRALVQSTLMCVSCVKAWYRTLQKPRFLVIISLLRRYTALPVLAWSNNRPRTAGLESDFSMSFAVASSVASFILLLALCLIPLYVFLLWAVPRAEFFSTSSMALVGSP